MAETVRLRNVSGMPLHVATLNGRLVDADAVVEIPARMLHHQLACTGIDRSFVPDKGTWEDGQCPGCLVWPEETWQVEAKTSKGGKP